MKYMILINRIRILSSSMSIADQIKCKAHPSEYITNYCSKSTCYTELCATCICEHTELHNRANTKPEYQNIKETFMKTNENLNKFKQSLNKEKTRIKNIMDGIEKKRKEVQKLFKQAKQDVLSLVERTFSDLEKQFNDQLTKEKQKTGLLNQTRLDELYSEINKRSLEVYSITQELNNLRQASNIKKVNTEFLPKGLQFKAEISQQISINQLFQPNVSYKSSYLEEVNGALKRLISLSFSYPISGDGKQVRRPGANKTPTKDPHQNQQNAMSTFPRANQIVIKNALEMRSPGKIEIQNGRPSNMRSTAKQNFWTGSLQPTMKVFSNTYSH